VSKPNDARDDRGYGVGAWSFALVGVVLAMAALVTAAQAFDRSGDAKDAAALGAGVPVSLTEFAITPGEVDVPVGGCSSDMGCFRVLTYRDDADGKRVAMGSDGWILAVEFGDEPRGYSILAYGESPKEDSPYHADQAEMFAKGQLKPIAWNEKDSEAQTIKRYRPGEAP